MKLPLIVLLLPLTFAAYSAKAYDEDYCREFTKKVRVGGQLQNAYGTACYRPDGSWEVVQEPRIRTQPGRIIYSNDRDDDDAYHSNYDRRDWRRHTSRPPVIVNYWEDRWPPGWRHGRHDWRKPCHRRPHYGHHYGHRYRHHGYGNRVNVSYSF